MLQTFINSITEMLTSNDGIIVLFYLIGFIGVMAIGIINYIFKCINRYNKIKDRENKKKRNKR